MAEGKIGLALGGGAFRGMAHIGVLQVLEENKIPFDLVAGTSIGSVVGGLYCCGVTPGMMVQLIGALDEKSLLDMRRPYAGLIEGKRLRELFRLLSAGRAVEQTNLPFAAVAVNFETGQMEAFRTGPICDAIRASISVPGVFVPHVIDGVRYVDGGLIDRVPVRTARQMGADGVIAVDVGYRGYKVRARNNMIEILLHSFDIIDWELAKNTISEADVLIAPDLAGADAWSFRDAESSVEAGRKSAEEALPAIRALQEKLGRL